MRALRLEGEGPGIRACLSEPKSQSEKISCQTENAQRSGRKQRPVRFRPEGDIPKQGDLQSGEGQREESGPKQLERGAEKRGREEQHISRDDKTMMKRHGALPGKPAQEGNALIFLVGCERGKAHDEEIRQRKYRQWKCNGEKQAVIFICLEQKTDRGNHVGQLRGEQELAKTAIEQAKRRNGI